MIEVVYLLLFALLIFASIMLFLLVWLAPKDDTGKRIFVPVLLARPDITQTGRVEDWRNYWRDKIDEALKETYEEQEARLFPDD